MHFGWTQPVYPRGRNAGNRAATSGRTVQRASTARLHLYLSRYLHLVTDLALDAPLEDIEESENTDDSFYQLRRFPVTI